MRSIRSGSLLVRCSAGLFMANLMADHDVFLPCAEIIGWWCFVVERSSILQTLELENFEEQDSFAASWVLNIEPLSSNPLRHNLTPPPPRGRMQCYYIAMIPNS